MSLLATCVGYLTPIFIILSPVLSYGDQAVSMHRKKSSAGFSLDIPLIMLIASLFRCVWLLSCFGAEWPRALLSDGSGTRLMQKMDNRIFYWPGARFDSSLLLQSLIMVGMQLALLKIALDHRPPPSNKGGEAGLPFAAPEGLFTQRPYNFWQWRSPKP